MRPCTARPLPTAARDALREALDVFFAHYNPTNARSSTRNGQAALAIGVNRKWSLRFVSIKEEHFRRPGVAAMVRAVDAALARLDPTFTYTSIQINKDFPGNLHVDRANAGDSRMLTVGHGVRGGELWCDGAVLPTVDRLVAFDGNFPHMTLPYRGTRYSVVLFTFSQCCTHPTPLESAAARVRTLPLRGRLPRPRTPRSPGASWSRRARALRADVGAARARGHPAGDRDDVRALPEERARTGRA